MSLYQYDTSQMPTIRLNFLCTVVHWTLIWYIGVPFVISILLVLIALFIERITVITSAVREEWPIEFLLLGLSESFNRRFILWVNVSVISVWVLYRQRVSILSIRLIIQVRRILIMPRLLLLIGVWMWNAGGLIGLVLVRIAAVSLCLLLVSSTSGTVVTPRMNVTVRSEQSMSCVHIWHTCVEDQQLEKTTLTRFGLYWRVVSYVIIFSTVTLVWIKPISVDPWGTVSWNNLKKKQQLEVESMWLFLFTDIRRSRTDVVIYKYLYTSFYYTDNLYIYIHKLYSVR